MHNWNFKQVESFLKKQNFRIHHIRGSHYYFVGFKNEKLRQVCVPFHGKSGTIKSRTMKSIILQSGMDSKMWFQQDK